MADERKPARFRLRRVPEDPAVVADPRVVDVLDQLAVARARAYAVVPPAEFRAELRAQLVAITPRIVAESAAESAPEVAANAAPQGVPVLGGPRPTPRPNPRPESSPNSPRRRSRREALRTIPLGRPLAVAASVITLLALVLGGAVWLSQGSVPGDTLYGLKRTGEDIRLSFAGSDAARASDKLEFAATRVQEARTLAGRPSALGTGVLASGRISPETAALITGALASADADTRQATSLLGSEAVKSGSPGPLSGLTTWVPSQLERLRDLHAAVPDDAKVSTATTQSMTLLQTARSRADALAKKVDCHCLQNAPTDVLGPLPVPATPSAPGGHAGVGSSPGRKLTSTSPTEPGTDKSGGGSGTKTSAPTRVPTLVPGTTDQPRQPTLPPVPSRGSGTPSLGDLCKVNILGIRVCPSTGN